MSDENHAAYCWRWHHSCAIRRIETILDALPVLRKETERLRVENERLRDEREVDEQVVADAMADLYRVAKERDELRAENEQLSKCCTQRGARLQIIRELLLQICPNGSYATAWDQLLWHNPDRAISTWFDADGVPVLRGRDELAVAENEKLRAENEELRTNADQLRRAIASLLKLDEETWPSHGNAPLAIAAAFALALIEAEKYKAMAHESEGE